ncbi:hypothetical protein D3C76_1586510 [compost metagenome]
MVIEPSVLDVTRTGNIGNSVGDQIADELIETILVEHGAALTEVLVEQRMRGVSQP